MSKNGDFDCAVKGCGCVAATVILLIVMVVAIAIIQAEMGSRRERKASEGRSRTVEKEDDGSREASELAVRESTKKAFRREEKLRQFALKEAPPLWNAYQDLQAEIESQNRKIEALRATLKNFNQDPERDADYKRICAMRDDMVSSLKIMRTKMEDAYLASRKYEESPSRKDLDQLRRKLLEDGLQEAESSRCRFSEMSRTK